MVSKVKPVYQQTTLFPKLGVVEISNQKSVEPTSKTYLPGRVVRHLQDSINLKNIFYLFVFLHLFFCLSQFSLFQLIFFILLLYFQSCTPLVKILKAESIPVYRQKAKEHPKAFQTPRIANTDVYKCSFFPQIITDWNVLPDSLISSAEDAEDCVPKLTSLVRARD